MQTHAEPHPARVISLPVLGLLLCACVGLSWQMVPKQGELIERLYKDKQYLRVVGVLEDEVHGMKSRDVSSLRDVSPEQIDTLYTLLNLTPREQLNTVFQSTRPPEYTTYIHHVVLAAVRFVNVISPEEALDLIAPHATRVPPEMRVELLRLIAHNANAQIRPDVASKALQLACATSVSDWTIAQEMVQSYRWDKRPDEAGRQLRAWLDTHRSKLKQRELAEARQLHYSLAMESGNPSLAFDVCVEDLIAVPTAKSIPNDLMERTMTTALQCNRTNDFTPWIRKYVGALPQASLPIQNLHAPAKEGGAQLDIYRKWLKTLAQWSDWNSAYDDAFDAHLRLAAMGDLESLDRCVMLYDYLGRTEECAALLLSLGELPARPELPLLLAHQLAELGRDGEAKPRFESWLAQHPKDRDARYDYSCLLEDLGDGAASRKAFTELLQRHPHDAPAMKKLAEAMIRDADYEGALKLYQRLPESAQDHDTLENYSMIAESLDDHQAEFAALKLTAKLAKEPTVEMYLNIAEASSYFDDPQPEIDSLNEGLKRLPDSARIRITLADTYLREDMNSEGLETLMHPSLKNNFEAVQTLLTLSTEIADPSKVLAFLGNDVDKRFALSDHNRLHLAVLNFNAGRRSESERLFASVKEGPDKLHLLAEARFQIGDFNEASRLMDAHLKSHPRALASQWQFLGDIYEQMGRFDDARKAYDYSIALLTADLPDTAAN